MAILLQVSAFLGHSKNIILFFFAESLLEYGRKRTKKTETSRRITKCLHINVSNHSEIFDICMANLFLLEKMRHISTKVYTYTVLYKNHCIHACIIAQNTFKQLFITSIVQQKLLVITASNLKNKG